VVPQSGESAPGGGSGQTQVGVLAVSSMAPTIITDAAGLRLVVGTPGGATIITSVAQIIARHEVEVRQLVVQQEPVAGHRDAGAARLLDRQRVGHRVIMRPSSARPRPIPFGWPDGDYTTAPPAGAAQQEH
jgi:hypothetical protein